MKRLILLALAALMAFGPSAAIAASPAMPSVSTPVYPASFLLGGHYTTSQTAFLNFRMPFTARVLYVTASIGAKGGTQGTSTVTCNNATNAFTNAMDISGTAGTIIEATLVTAQQSIAKDAIVSCDLVLSGGSSPTLDNITVVIWYQRRN